MELIIILLIAVEVVIVCFSLLYEIARLTNPLLKVSHQRRSRTLGHVIPPQTRWPWKNCGDQGRAFVLYRYPDRLD